MSRLAQRSAPPAAPPGDGGDMANEQEGPLLGKMLTTDSPKHLLTNSLDKCPNCRNSRYLNPNLTFLMSPLCYHKMCSTCVDRIFGAGPAECPIAGCHKVLRKTEFRTQTFADAAIEREVDIRRRVDAVLGGHAEGDFEDLLAYNDYLELVENIAFDLTQRIDEETNWTKLRALEADKKKRSRGTADKAGMLQLKRTKQPVAAAAGGRSGTATPVPAAAPDGGAALNGSSTGFVIRGLKKREDTAKAVQGALVADVFDAFGGLRRTPRYFVSLEHYEAAFLDSYRRDEKAMAGGYDMDGYCLRALNDAFSGLGVFIDDEKMEDAEALDASTIKEKKAARQPKRRAATQDDDVF